MKPSKVTLPVPPIPAPAQEMGTPSERPLGLPDILAPRLHHLSEPPRFRGKAAESFNNQRASLRAVAVTALKFPIDGGDAELQQRVLTGLCLRGIPEWEARHMTMAEAMEVLRERPGSEKHTAANHDDIFDRETVAILRVLNGAVELLDHAAVSAGTSECFDGVAISPKTCGKRLAELEARGYVNRPAGERKGYALTKTGKALKASGSVR